VAQEPGPRGSPHEPQGPEAKAPSLPAKGLEPGELPEALGEAKVENCFSALCPWQLGQVGCSAPKSNSVKGVSQDLQTNW
jgi:hypothetical protein